MSHLPELPFPQTSDPRRQVALRAGGALLLDAMSPEIAKREPGRVAFCTRAAYQQLEDLVLRHDSASATHRFQARGALQWVLKLLHCPDSSAQALVYGLGVAEPPALARQWLQAFRWSCHASREAAAALLEEVRADRHREQMRTDDGRGWVWGQEHGVILPMRVRTYLD